MDHAHIILQATATAESKDIQILAYGGGAMTVAPHGRVAIDLDGLQLPDQVPLLSDHNANIDGVVGWGRPEIKAGKLLVRGRISAVSAAAIKILGLAKAGATFQASVGVEALPGGVVRVPAGRPFMVNGQTISEPGEVLLVTKSRLRETSILAIGADGSTSVAIAASAQGKNMDMKNAAVVFTAPTNVAPTPAPAAPVVNAAAATVVPQPAPAVDSVTVDRARVSEIVKLAAKYPGTTEVQAKAIAEGWDLNRTELEMIRAQRPQAPAVMVRANVAGPEVIQAAMCMSLGLPESFVGKQYNPDVMNAALSSRFRGAGIHSALRAVLSAAGRLEAGFDRVDATVIEAAFAADLQLKASGFSTMSLPGILSAVANKVLLNSYQAVAVAWPAIAAIAEGKDFKTLNRYRLTGSGAFSKVGQDGELKSVSLSEQSYTNQIDTQGAIIQVTRKQIINDDTGALAQIPRVLGRMAALSLEEQVFTLLLSNPSGFFAAGNGNYIDGADTVLSIAGLDAAEKAFLEMVDDNGKPMLVVPKTILCPPAISGTAASLIKATEIRDNTSDKKAYPTTNPHAGRFGAACSPFLGTKAALAGASDTAWYLVADPAAGVAAMEVAFLNGQNGPTIESGNADFATLGIQYRAFFDFGVAMQDKHGAVMSKGAA